MGDVKHVDILWYLIKIVIDASLNAMIALKDNLMINKVANNALQVRYKRKRSQLNVLILRNANKIKYNFK